MLLASCLALAFASPYGRQGQHAASAAPQGIDWTSMMAANPYLQSMRTMSLDQITKNTNIINDFDKNSIPVLTESTAATIPMADELTKVATPLLAEMTKAIVPSIQKYTEELRRYNQQGGTYPTPPHQLIQFGTGHVAKMLESNPRSAPYINGRFVERPHYTFGDYTVRNSIPRTTSRGRVSYSYIY